MTTPPTQLAIDKTATNTRLPRVKLHRGRAILSKDRKHITPATSECLFVQGARALNAKPSTYLRATLDEQKECVTPCLVVLQRRLSTRQSLHHSLT